jgi:putative flippase GtrA
VIARSAKSLWSDQRIRFLAAGAFNTGCSIIVYDLIYFFLAQWIHRDPRIIADIAIVLSIVPNVTTAYITNKLIVFQTRGNVCKEYFRFYFIYAIPIGSAFIFIPVIMTLISPLFGPRYTAYAAQALFVALTVPVSYYGHKLITFRHHHPAVMPTPSTEASRRPTSR